MARKVKNAKAPEIKEVVKAAPVEVSKEPTKSEVKAEPKKAAKKSAAKKAAATVKAKEEVKAVAAPVTGLELTFALFAIYGKLTESQS